MSEPVEPTLDPVERAGPEERAYLLGRAAAHRALADSSDEPGAQAVHLRLEQLYHERAAQVDMVDRH